MNYTVYQNVIHLHFSTHNLFLPVGRTRHSFSMKLLSNKLLVKQKSVCWSIFSNYFCYLFLTIACSYNFLGLLQVFLQIFLCLCTCLSFAHIIYFNDVMFLDMHALIRSTDTCFILIDVLIQRPTILLN